MYEYHYVAIETGGFFSARLEAHRQLIRDYAEEGWRYVGWVPTNTTSSGMTCEVDLIFEREIRLGGV
ncbi:MAG: DUF4177 domain-containing protein [Clostridia bacterium]|nr:DUF4177 domain-containing protein [Clostridia bacterium]